jgi:hypothetical protein
MALGQPTKPKRKPSALPPEVGQAPWEVDRAALRARLEKNQATQQGQQLQGQLATYDTEAQKWFDKVREAYGMQTQMAAGQQMRTDVGALGRSATRAGWSTGGFQSGFGIQAEAMLRQAYGQDQLNQLAQFDTAIQGQIATGRLNVTLGHFDYVRQLSLLKNQFQYEKQLLAYQVQLAQSNSQSVFSQIVNGLAGIAGTAGGYWMAGKIL